MELGRAKYARGHILLMMPHLVASIVKSMIFQLPVESQAMVRKFSMSSLLLDLDTC